MSKLKKTHSIKILTLSVENKTVSNLKDVIFWKRNTFAHVFFLAPPSNQLH